MKLAVGLALSGLSLSGSKHYKCTPSYRLLALEFALGRDLTGALVDNSCIEFAFNHAE